MTLKKLCILKIGKKSTQKWISHVVNCAFTSRFFSRLESNMLILPSIHMKTFRLKMFNSYVDWNMKSKCITIWFKMLLHCTSLSLHWSLRKAFLFLLAILWNLHSNAYIFPFLLCLLFLFFSQLFVRPPQKTICLFALMEMKEFRMTMYVQLIISPSVYEKMCILELLSCKGDLVR